MSTNAIDAIAARLTALGYSVTADQCVLAISDTLVGWFWPDGAEVCENRPTVLIDHGTDQKSEFWRWELQFFGKQSVYLHAADSWRGVDVGDAVLAHLRPPGELLRIAIRNPADLAWGEKVTQARPDPSHQDWWTAWHTWTARPRLVAAAVRHGRVDRWWPLIRTGQLSV